MKIKPYVTAVLISICFISHYLNLQSQTAPASDRPGVAVLLVDTDRQKGRVEEAVYGHFLEHINHSVVDGLFA